MGICMRNVVQDSDADITRKMTKKIRVRRGREISLPRTRENNAIYKMQDGS